MTETPRQRALRALRSVQALPENERAGLMRTKAAINTQVLTRNMLAYFEGALLSEDGVPAFTLQEFTDSMADALVQFGKTHDKGGAVLQTLVLELQDRINKSIT